MKFKLAAIVAVLVGLALTSTANAQTTILLRDNPNGTAGEYFRCTQPISTYATNGLPLHIDAHVSNSEARESPVNGMIRVESGCTGDGTNAIDLTFEIDGNGADIGPAGDSFVIAGATDLQIGPSRADCGAGGAQAGHEDAFRANRGHRVTLYRFQSGNWLTLDPTCHGAGGNAYFDNVNQDVNGTTNIRCIECIVVASAYAPNPSDQGNYGVGAGFGWSTDSGAIRGCWAAVRPTFHYRNSSGPLAVRAIDVDNFTIQFAVGTNTPLSGEPPASACPILSGPIPDTTPPSAPTNLHVIDRTFRSITVAWNASTDNVGVAGYYRYRDGVRVVNTGLTLTHRFSLSTWRRCTQHTLAVQAYDAAGNVSPRTSIVARTRC